MKIERHLFTPFLILLSLLALSRAQAFYDPATGCWLSRDPVGESGGEALTVLAGNNPQGNVDPTGLASFGIDPIDVVWQKLNKALTDTYPSDLVMTTWLYAVLEQFGGVAMDIKAKYDKPSRTRNALWLIGKNTMTIENPSVAPTTIMHEMTHAYQDKVLHWTFSNERVEEGQAYAVEGFQIVGMRLKADERKYARIGCNQVMIKGLWQSFWKQYGVLPGEWPKVGWDDHQGDSADPMSVGDIWSVRATFDLKLSCHEIADVVNSLIGASGCCATVKCSGKDTPNEYGPGIEIYPDFQ